MNDDERLESQFLRKSTPELYARLFVCRINVEALRTIGKEFLTTNPSETLARNQKLHLAAIVIAYDRAGEVEAILLNNSRRLSKKQFRSLFGCLVESFEREIKEATEGFYELGRKAPEVTVMLNELGIENASLKDDALKAARIALNEVRRSA